MSVLIGGSGSTGSTLLRNILNRHDEIFCGSELNLFNKEKLFINWNRNKYKLLKYRRSFSTDGWVAYPGNHLLNEDYYWKYRELKQIINDSDTFQSFAEKFFSKPLKRERKNIWMEKTPSNCYSFSSFLRNFDNSKLITTVRNPLDSVNSLSRRGFSIFYATGMWVYNTACALNIQNEKQNYILKYENLVTNPDIELNKLFEYLNLNYSNKILDPKIRKVKGKSLDTWSNNPSNKISKNSINSFKNLTKETQDEIITALNVFQISQKHINQRNLKYNDAREICKYLGYDLPNKIEPKKVKNIRTALVKDYFLRGYKNYSTAWSNYPARIKFKESIK
ncbi:MAG: sulfotransferase family protein [Bacillota bacterium]